MGSNQAAKQRGNKMIKYEPRISKVSDGSFYALIVRIGKDGEESVIRGFAKFFKSKNAAKKSAITHIGKIS